MKTLIPTLFALLIIGTTQAQNASYASLSPQKTSPAYSTSSDLNEPYIKIKARAENKVLLSWAPIKGGVSHYVLERSADGHTFQEQGLFFTGDWDEETEYFYTEKFRKLVPGALYYRLRVVGVDGSVIYTPVTILYTSVGTK